MLITQQWYAGSAGMSSRNLAFTLPDRAWAGCFLIPSANGQKFSSVFLIAELRGVEERKSKLSSEGGQALSRTVPGVTPRKNVTVWVQ